MRQSALSIVRGIHGPQWEEVYASFSPEFRGAISKEKHRALTEEIERERGKLVDAVYAEEEPIGTKGARQIRVVAIFERGAAIYTISLDTSGVLYGLSRTPLVAPSKDDPRGGPGPADDYVAKRAYAFPGHGQWYVGQGGRDRADNSHGGAQQWYAFDLVRHGSDKKSYRGDGTKNEDYFIFGDPILAPADGTIVSIVDGVADNVPHDESGAVATGNHAVIDHGDGEYSFLC